MAARQAPQSAPMWPADWRVPHASFVTETAGSTIWRVRLVGAPGTAVAKVLKPAADAADELRAARTTCAGARARARCACWPKTD